MPAMSVQNGLLFIQRCRRETDLRAQVQAADPRAGLEALVEMGVGAGLLFSAADLREAHRQDWIMRWFHQHATSE